MNFYLTIKPILGGIFAALGALFLEVLLAPFFPFSFHKITLFFVLAVFIEEVMKTIIILQNRQDFTSRSIFILQSALIGFGFWLAEFSIKKLFNPEVFLSVNIGTFFIHILTALIIGWTISQKEVFSKIGLSLGFLLAFLIHITYNIFVFLVFLA